MDLENLQNQLNTTESALGAYNANLPSEINKQIQEAYTPALERSLGVTRDLMGDYLGRYFDTTTMGPGMAGTTALDLSPTQKLGVMGRELGTMAGELGYSQRLSDYLGGQMKDMYSQALQASQLGQQGLADQYSRQMQRLQMAWQEAQAEKDRQLQRELAARSGGGGGFVINPQTTQPSSTRAPGEGDILRAISGIANQIAGQRGKVQGPYSYGGYSGNIDQIHSALLNEARNLYGINLNPEWLWQQLGNNVNQYQTVRPVL
jgi:hypothetical protein